MPVGGCAINTKVVLEEITIALFPLTQSFFCLLHVGDIHGDGQNRGPALKDQQRRPRFYPKQLAALGAEPVIELTAAVLSLHHIAGALGDTGAIIRMGQFAHGSGEKLLRCVSGDFANVAIYIKNFLS